MVATVHELTSSATAVSYYEKDGYYAKNDPEHRKASFWHGAAARDLGLRGHVVPSRFESVLSGRVPKTDIRLGRIVEGEHQHRPGWDITCSAPKSVSIEALVVGDTRVIRAHDEAVRATLDWIEADLLETRGWDPATRRRPRVKADGMAVAGFRHLTSRDLDPQLHTHCIVANMTRNREGAWRSIEPTLLRRNERLIGAHYRNELAARLTALGFIITPRMVGDVPGFELAGYDQAFLDAFSGRRREILKYLDEHGLPHTKEALQKATLHTRRRKVDAGLDELVPQWRERARSLGLRRDVEALAPPRPCDPVTGEATPFPEDRDAGLPLNERRRRRRSPAVPLIGDGTEAGLERVAPARTRTASPSSGAPPELVAAPETGVLEAVARAIAHHEERRTVIPERAIRTLALSHAPGRYSLSEIDSAIRRLVTEGTLIETQARGSDRSFVTDRAVKAERRILALHRQGVGTAQALAGQADVEARLAGTRLTQGQADAVRTILLSQDRIIGVQGHAGTGKTTMLRTVAECVGSDAIIGLAPSAAAARVLRKEAGIGARTLQWFLVRHQDLSDPVRLQRARQEYQGRILAVDEASMIGTVQMEALLHIAQQLGVARVVLSGDTAQLKSITAGQPFGLLQKAGMETAVMDEVLRQKDPDLKVAVAHAREGEAAQAIIRLDNRVREHHRETLGAEAARRWLDLEPDDRARCAVLAPTHAVRLQINNAIRERLAEEGVLHGATLKIERLVPRRLTRQQTALASSYHAGDEVVFHRDAYGCRRDDVCLVREIHDDAIVLDHDDGRERRFRPSGNAARNLGVFETAPIEIRAGDRIRWTRNLRGRGGRNPHPELVNGEEALVTEIGRKRVQMETAHGEIFSLARTHSQLRHLDHAWSSTVHSAQGRTAPKVIAVLDAGGMAQSDLFYVEVSRASEGFSLLTDDREALIEALETSPEVPDSALEALGEDFDAAVVDPDEAAALLADWKAIEDEAERTGRLTSTIAGYDDVMARIASFAAIEDLPEHLRAFTDERLVAHASAKAAEREVTKLIGDITDHWRRWPELAWAAGAGSGPDIPRRQPWMERGARLLDAASRWLAAPSRIRGLEHATTAVETSASRLRRAMARADAEAFARRWQDMEPRLDGEAALLRDDYRALAADAATLMAAGGSGEEDRRAIEGWWAFDERQRALMDDVTRHPEAGARLLGAIAVDDETGADPDAPAVLAWRRDAGTWLEKARVLLASPGHAPYLGATPGSRALVEGAVRDMERALVRLDHGQLLWRLKDLEARAGAAGVLGCDIDGWTALVDDVRNIPDREDDDVVWELARRVVNQDHAWHHERDLIAEVATALQDLEATRPAVGAPDADDWRQRAADVTGLLAILPPRDTVDWRSHCRARGVDPDDLGRLIDRLPGMLETANAGEELGAWLERTIAWQDEAARTPPSVPADGRHDLVHRANALMDEGRSLPGLWESRGIKAADMAGARAGIDRAISGIAASLVRMETEEFVRLTEAVEGLRSSIHPLDDANMAFLRESIGRLDSREELGPELRRSLDTWRSRIAHWEEERREVGCLAMHALRLEADRPGGATAAPADWPRRARALVDDAARLRERMSPQDLARHVRAHGHDPDHVARIIEAAPGWLSEEDALREERDRGAHLVRLRHAMNEVRAAAPGPAPTVPWNGTAPLVRGDRLRWHDADGMHDMIVSRLHVNARDDRSGKLFLEPLAGEGDRASLDGYRIREIAAQGGLRRHLWPDEDVRNRELTRQYATPDETFSLPCDDGVAAGDRIRWTCLWDPGLFNDGVVVEGDTPQVEATVEEVSQDSSWRGRLVTLKVERSWGEGNAPKAGTVIYQRESELAWRGCVRVPWDDESLRAARLEEARKMDLSKGRSRGRSM